MLNHVSHAANGADNNPSEKRSEVILFDANSTSATSQTFSVNKDPVYIGCFNLSATDTFIIKMVTNVSPNEQYADYCPVDGPITLSETLTKYRLDMPGRYALLYTGPGTNYTSTIVKAFPGEMSHESNSHIAAALTAIAANIGSQSNAVVQGTAPITVTGNGAPATPYVIGATVASNAEVEAGTPADKLVDVVGLKHIVNATTASQNAYLSAGLSTLPGFGSIFVGHNAGAGSSNVGLTNAHNILIGHGCGLNGNLNNSIAIGLDAGNDLGSATVTQDAIFIGHSAGQNDDFVSDGTVAIGLLAGSTNAPPASNFRHNVFVGEQSGFQLTSASDYNVCVGFRSGFSASLGGTNLVIGREAALNSTVAAGSLAIGASAARNNAAFSGVAIGGGALNSATSGLNCVAIGPSAGTSATLGDGCIVIGNSAAGESATTNLDIGSIAVGENAFFDAVVTGSSIAIGRNAGNAETFNNVVIIGSDATALNATQNNQIILGNNTQTQLVTAGSIIQGGVIGPSDKRLKKNVENYTSGLEAINKLRPVMFDWDENALKQANINILRDDIQRKQHGLIAQELEEVFPTFMENVNRGFGDYKFIHNERLIPVMISAIKELSEQVNYLTKEFNKKSTKKGVEDNV